MTEPGFAPSCIKHWSFRCDPTAIDMPRILREAEEVGAEVVEVVPGMSAEPIVLIRDSALAECRRVLSPTFLERKPPTGFVHCRHPGSQIAQSTGFCDDDIPWTDTGSLLNSVLAWVRDARARAAAGVRTTVRCHRA
jgi:hypothetical protein